MIYKLASERHSMANLLRCNIENILRHWGAATRAHIPSDQTLSRPRLRNSMHSLLLDLADTLDDGSWNCHAKRATKVVEISREHALQRFDTEEHGLDQLLDEYAELRRAVIQRIAGNVPCTNAGVERIHEFIDASLKQAACLFTALQLREAQDQRKGQALEHRDEP